ncbi:MAG: 16S rRNA (cytidine(1402)-2'-O)-methyltransferase [bacterium]|nr:16S rRNA (cytidine(1402)-2'-O)-methyltransferase [bacterium]
MYKKNIFNYNSTFFVVATPIGNLSDITIRALDILRNVDLIASEDTRQTRKLLLRFEINKPRLISYHKFSKGRKDQFILKELLDGKNIALVSDAGTPLIADPGYSLVQFLKKKDIKIEVLPGACSIINGLVLTGVKTSDFVFGGWFPRKDTQRLKVLSKFLTVTNTLVFLESPHRILKSLKLISSYKKFENLKVYIAREMTKIYEEVISGSPEDVLEILDKKKVKGEIVLVLTIYYNK